MQEPPYLDTIPPSRGDFDRSIGRAIVSWQQVESDLCDLFYQVSSCQNKEISAAIFFTPQDFNIKLEATRNAMRLYLNSDLDPNGELTKEWKALRKELIAGSEVRNCLAHFQIIYRIEPDPTKELIQKDGGLQQEGTITLALLPNFKDPNSQFKDPNHPSSKPIYLTGIKGAIPRFNILCSRIRALLAKIPSLQTPQKEQP